MHVYDCMRMHVAGESITAIHISWQKQASLARYIGMYGGPEGSHMQIKNVAAN